MSNHFFAPSKVAKCNQQLEKKIVENIRSHSVSKGFKKIIWEGWFIFFFCTVWSWFKKCV